MGSQMGCNDYGLANSADYGVQNFVDDDVHRLKERRRVKLVGYGDHGALRMSMSRKFVRLLAEDVHYVGSPWLFFFERETVRRKAKSTKVP